MEARPPGRARRTAHVRLLPFSRQGRRRPDPSAAPVAGKLVGLPLYFLGGVLGFAVTTAVLLAPGLMPFRMSRRDLEVSLAFSGGVSIVVGLLFYSFQVPGDRLAASVERIEEQGSS
jgi:hypothetical protein